MAKKSKIAKAQKREALVAKYAEKRAALKASGDVGQDFDVRCIAFFIHDGREQQADFFSPLFEIIKILRAQR